MLEYLFLPQTHHRGGKQLPLMAVSSFRPTLKRFLLRGSHCHGSRRGSKAGWHPFAARLFFLLLARMYVGRVGSHLQAREMCGDFAFLGVALLLHLVCVIVFTPFVERCDVEVGRG
jgi:hypothetical protein